jgi:hypothetical protein
MTPSGSKRYALGGAVAAAFYLDPIATVVVDFFIAFRAESGRLRVSTTPVFDDLTACGHAVEGEYLGIAGWPVQFLPPTGPLVEEALARAGETVPWRIAMTDDMQRIIASKKAYRQRLVLCQCLTFG